MLDDKNGQLVLVAEGKDKIDLPPLRMDDVVTVFRSVYQHGEAPFVSIDPDPQNPRGPIMLVRHGEATANTYVGWVLFEADRVMKAYSLGRDNVTRQEIKSAIDGYQNLLDLGFSNFDKPQKEATWERFWIVPAQVSRRHIGRCLVRPFDDANGMSGKVFLQARFKKFLRLNESIKIKVIQV